MNLLLLLPALVAVLALQHLARTVLRDGLGSRPGPRSHEAELGTWVDRQLRR